MMSRSTVTNNPSTQIEPASATLASTLRWLLISTDRATARANPICRYRLFYLSRRSPDICLLSTSTLNSMGSRAA